MQGAAAVKWITEVRERARGRLVAARQAGPPPPPDFGDDTQGTERVLVVEPRPTVDDGVPRGVRVAAAWAWRVILLVGGAYVVVRLIGVLHVVVIPVVVAVLLAALLE